jgi:hypothetical protein
VSLGSETKAKENAMLLNAFTVFHVVLSLIGIGAGVVAIYGLIRAITLPGCPPWRSASCRSSP